MSQEALDKRCEIWLDRVFGLKLDFAIENSLPVCLEDGVIERDSQVGPPPPPPCLPTHLCACCWSADTEQASNSSTSASVVHSSDFLW